MSKLNSENIELGPYALDCFLESDKREVHDSEFENEYDDIFYNWGFEHGQLWIISNTGATWSVVDCFNKNGFYFDFEQISEGEHF